MAQVAPGISRWELKYIIPNNHTENVFHVQKTGLSAFTDAEMTAIKSAFVTWFTSSGSNYLSDQLSLYEIIGTDLTSLSGIRKAYGVDPALDGNMSGEYLPANVTFALKASTGRRGRGTSGRTFWPALTAPQVVNNNIEVASADLIVDSLNTLVAAMGGLAGMDGLCVPHFMVGGVRPPSVAADPVENYLYSDIWLDAQRDRLPEHRRHKKKKVTTP